jgi:UDP-N-acetylmuramoyl-L-alanyl-D-glutamate--2,6-diaminopimelate ligase
MELDALIAALAPSEVRGRQPVDILDLAYDTRSLQAGALFFCVPGERVDRHDLAGDAVAAGAAALVVERPLDVDVPQLVVPDARVAMAVAADVFFGEPTRELEVAGVTGTNGKRSR